MIRLFLSGGVSVCCHIHEKKALKCLLTLFPMFTLHYCIPQDAFGHPASEMRIGELRPSLPETPLYPPKLVLLGKDKKGTNLTSSLLDGCTHNLHRQNLAYSILR